MWDRQTIAIVGNPNCGKTTLFNGLTGGRQKVGNWPGVTVEKIEGVIQAGKIKIPLIDLPGVYSVSASSEDEKVARDYILSNSPDLVINILDGANLERNLYLTTQLLEMNVPVVVILNRMDVAKKMKLEIDIDELSRHLGCTVTAISALKNQDIKRVKELIIDELEKKEHQSLKINYPPEVKEFAARMSQNLKESIDLFGADERWVSLKLLEGDHWIQEKAIAAGMVTRESLDDDIKKIEEVFDESADIVLADFRYAFIHGLCKEIIKKTVDKRNLTEIIDRVILNRFLGIPFFLLAMYLVFWVTINIGGAFIDFFDKFFGAFFVSGMEELLSFIHAPQWLITILAGGVGTGIQTVSTFIPVIFTMFFMMSILEDSGYMARAAFVMDRFMRTIGLPGKSFVPLLIGFGCTVPAVMATRTLESKKDRFLTIFMSPLMSCGARLPVYVLFTAAFFSERSGLIVFSLYLAGIIVAVLTGLLLKKTIFEGEASHFVMELPLYNAPRLKNLFIFTWMRLKDFVIRASKIIVLIVVILSFLNSLGADGTFGNENSEKSVLSKIGKTITPVFTPMGIEEKNWPASVSLFTGIFAKEAVIGTLNSLYSQKGETQRSSEKKPPFNLKKEMTEAFSTIPENLAKVRDSFLDPLGLTILEETREEKEISSKLEVREGVLEELRVHFSHSEARSYAYLLFILLYFPCVVTLGVVNKEAGSLFTALQLIYLTATGWITATLFYQIAEGRELIWIAIPILLLGGEILLFYILKKKDLFGEKV